MIKIAVIGDIGSGKSYVAKQFGYPVFNADNEVTKLYKKNRKCYNKLKKELPNYVTTFPIQKEELSKAVLDNHNNLKKITKIIHPLVRRKMNIFLKKNKNKKLVVLDIPLLMENKINKNNYFLVFVDAKQKEMTKRLKKRPNFNLKIFNKLRKLQLPVEKKRKTSDFIIKNNFKHDSTKKNVKNLLEKILFYA
tara:strand:+ start:113 stop:691 length:579 start_codon:yes stop_codon:yes gene_type:complete